MTESTVYFTKDVSADALVRIFEALNHPLKEKVGVKISSGEPGGNNYLHPELIKKIVDKVHGTIIECNTAYEGGRNTTERHWKAMEDHGFVKNFPCDIMDEEGQIDLPVENGFHLDKDIVGSHFRNYDSILVLSHFKGHAMAGLGGALKNISIGIASSAGKTYIHTAGKSDKPEKLWDCLAKQDDFLESMADACKAVIHDKGAENMLYINVAYRLSVDCDCDSHPAEPEMKDLGIFASLDPVAIDQACYDTVKNAQDEGKKALIERMDSRHGIHTIEAAEKHGLGSRSYRIVSID